MLLLRRRHRFAAWLTLVVMSLALLAPGISRAVTFAKGDAVPWGAICSANADRRTAPVDEPAAPAAPAAHALDACALCTLAGDTPPLPPPAARLAEPPALAQAMPRLFLHAPHPLFAWHSAQPRAPPFSS